MGRGTPIRCTAADTCDKVRRYVFCRNYGDCLDQAIRKKWPGFSCERCAAYEQELLEGGQFNDRYARNLVHVFFG